MVPAEKVVTCKQTDTIKTVMDLMLEHNIGAVVVPNSPDHPIGIITKTDIVQAYHDNVSVDHKAQEIMHTELEVCDENMNRDQAAHILERNKNHHAVVVDKNGEFRGLISSWDITAECARDDRAWPWNRQEGGKFAPKSSQAGTSKLGTSPTTPVDEAHISNVRGGEGEQRKSQMGDSFRDYIDHLGLVDM